MNAAMSASVVLASRLPDDISVFALMLFSIQIFALFPILRMRLLVIHCASSHLNISLIFFQLSPSPAIILMTGCFAGVSIYLWSMTSLLVTCIQSGILIFITFVAPWMLVWSQRFKK